MGKTHLSGLEIGDVSTGIFAGVQLVQKLRFAAINAPQKITVPDGAFITMIRIASDAGALVVATIRLGTTSGAADILAATATTAGAALAVEKNVAPGGNIWVELTVGAAPPYNVFISYLPVSVGP